MTVFTTIYHNLPRLVNLATTYKNGFFTTLPYFYYRYLHIRVKKIFFLFFTDLKKIFFSLYTITICFLKSGKLVNLGVLQVVEQFTTGGKTVVNGGKNRGKRW